MDKFLLCFILFFIISKTLCASDEACHTISLVPISESIEPVFSKLGNIYYIDNSGHSIQITRTGNDSSPVLSPNKNAIAFVRVGNKIIPDSCDIDAKYGNEVWLYDFSTKKEKRLVQNNFQCDNPKKQITDPRELLFSPDSKVVYFITTAWTTSGAIHAVDANGKHLRFLTDGNVLDIVQSGPYKGDLIVNQHRYRFKDDTPLGSYDWDWLFTPTGKQIKLYKKED